ncbi:MAG TPA: DUF2442 domain-containing protein [Acidimicrobiales bacterium]|nr:DUF2442 domain-containing protein [Acidimicrobiales bacterium]
MGAPYDLRTVEHLDGYKLRIGFADGTVRELDFAPKLARPVGPVFEPLRDVSFFARVTVDPETHTVVWPNGADMAPDALHDGITDPVRVA